MKNTHDSSKSIYALRRVLRLRGFKEALRRDDVSPIIRRFFINTLFDSTFMLLGIIVGTAFARDISIQVVLVTMVTSSLALGISTGVSVYEAESLERERKILELERALFRDLSGTRIEKSARSIVILTALINFSTPPVACAVTMLPFLFAALKILEVEIAVWLSVVVALSVLFVAGVYMGRLGKRNPWAKGLRMMAFGLAAFVIGFILNVIV